MSEVTRTAGVAGSFPVTFTQTPVEPPTLTLYSDAARTLQTVAPTLLTATANPLVWTASYPATLEPGRYYLTVAARYTAGQPQVIDSNDVLVLTTAASDVAGGLVTVDAAAAYLDAPADADLARLIEAASDLVRDYCGASFGIETVPEVATASGGELILSRYPVVEVLSLGAVTFDGASYDVAVYDIGTYYGVAGGPLLNAGAGIVYSPYSHGRVEVVYTAGTAAVPALVRQVVLDIVRVLNDTRPGTLPAGVDVAEENEFPRFPFSVDSLLARLAPYRRGPRVG